MFLTKNNIKAVEDILHFSVTGGVGACEEELTVGGPHLLRAVVLLEPLEKLVRVRRQILHHHVASYSRISLTLRGKRDTVPVSHDSPFQGIG